MLRWAWRSAGWTASLVTSAMLSQLPQVIATPISNALLPKEHLHYTENGHFIHLKHGQTYYQLLEPIDEDSSHEHSEEEDELIACKLESSSEDCEKILDEIPPCGISSPNDAKNCETKLPLVIFLHGVNLFGFVWDPFAKLLSKRGYRVLTFDFYGHGYSAIPDVDYTSDVLCEQVEELVTRLELADLQSKHREQEVYVVGHSMGGLIASEFTARHGDVVTKLILLNSVGLPVNTRAHLIPGIVHFSLVLFRHITWFDSILLRLGQIIGTHTRMLGMTHHDILEAAHSLSEEISKKSNLNPFSLIFRSAHRINSAQLRGFSTIRRQLSNSHRRYHDRINYVTQSLRGLSFVVKAWMYQCSLSVERGRVWLSLLRNLPLIDARRHETFSKIAEKKTPLLLIWGNDDSILPSSLVAQFQRTLNAISAVFASNGTPWIDPTFSI
ncbi:alpha/beta hydrolase fold protein [Planoprotostelium fungivorum]|uniref:Alpha/beta hydrolase fold protein n=1 Tax=Planoprotostelium fungivorum TaxID=1890364 RepID=A0A2P6NWI3_9EUKA|nr:alpha/beta hydrolase fold protein [Planoprotostelium fungivorum]